MIIDVFMILVFAIGSGTGESIEYSSATANTSSTPPPRIDTNCYRNGIWYNPCPPNPEPPPDPPPDPIILDQQ